MYVSAISFEFIKPFEDVSESVVSASEVFDSHANPNKEILTV